MTLPNLISASRIAVTPVLMFLLLDGRPGGAFVAALLLVLAGVSDSFDGYLARRFKQVSTFGVFLDLTADKILVSAVIVTLVQLQLLPAWVAAIIIGREFIITGLRLSAASGGLVIPAQGWGKTKTVTTIIALTFIFLREDLRAGGPTLLFNAFGAVGFLLDRFTWPLVLLATALTIVSGLSYIHGALSVASEKKRQENVASSSAFLPQPDSRLGRQPKRSPVYRLYRKMREVW